MKKKAIPILTLAALLSLPMLILYYYTYQFRQVKKNLYSLQINRSFSETNLSRASSDSGTLFCPGSGGVRIESNLCKNPFRKDRSITCDKASPLAVYVALWTPFCVYARSHAFLANPTLVCQEGIAQIAATNTESLSFFNPKGNSQIANRALVASILLSQMPTEIRVVKRPDRIEFHTPPNAQHQSVTIVTRTGWLHTLFFRNSVQDTVKLTEQIVTEPCGSKLSSIEEDQTVRDLDKTGVKPMDLSRTIVE